MGRIGGSKRLTYQYAEYRLQTTVAMIETWSASGRLFKLHLVSSNPKHKGYRFVVHVYQWGPRGASNKIAWFHNVVTAQRIFPTLVVTNFASRWSERSNPTTDT